MNTEQKIELLKIEAEFSWRLKDPKFTTEGRRQTKIDEAISELENRIKEFETERDYFSINQNFCPYKVATAIEAMEKHKNYLEIVKTLS